MKKWIKRSARRRRRRGGARRREPRAGRLPGRPQVDASASRWRWCRWPSPRDATSLERGRYLFATRGCADCHGANGGGHVFVDDGKACTRRRPTSRRGRAASSRRTRPEDWVRTIRHGVKPNGRPAVHHAERGLQPPHRRRPRRARRLREASLPPVQGAGLVARHSADAGEDALRRRRHPRRRGEDRPHAAAVRRRSPEDGSAAHGAYVANGCIGCHGAALVRRQDPRRAARLAARGQPHARRRAARCRATPSAEQFMAMLRSGKRPDGSGRQHGDAVQPR